MASISTSLKTISFILLIWTALGGCQSQYMQFDEEGRRIPPSDLRCELRGSEFERSLCEKSDEIVERDKVLLCLKQELLGEFAARDGAGSQKALLFSELSNLHVGYDSARIAHILREGLLELDRQLETDDVGLDAELSRRAEQILAYGCFLPESLPHFDELGMLIAIKGVFTVESWTETTWTISFRDHTVYLVGENADYSYKVLLVAHNVGELSRLVTSGNESDPESDQLPTVSDLAGGVKLGMDAKSQSQALETDRWRRIDIPVDYEPLKFSTVNLYAIPTSYGDGLWNGQEESEADKDTARWQWTRCYLDFYINAEELCVVENDAGASSPLELEYEIRRLNPGDSASLVRETLHAVLDPASLSPGAGLTFRTTTQPFYTGEESVRGYHEISLKATCGAKTMVRRFPIHVRLKQYDLMILDTTQMNRLSLPGCVRQPRTLPGGRVTFLLPYEQLPFSLNTGKYSGEVRIYLTNNEDIGVGAVSVSEATPFDENGTSAIIDHPEARALPVTLVDSFRLEKDSPIGYLIHTVTLPDHDSNGDKLRRGKYTLAVSISSEGHDLSSGITNNLMVD